jgi:FkbM family methyltransferase
MCAIDIGANIGYFSMLAASLVGETGMVYCFEPGRENVKLLCANRRLNNFHQVTIIPAAADTQAGVLSFSNSFSNGFVESIDHLDITQLLSSDLVPAVKVDDVVSHERRVDLFKVDAEGYEFKALSGALEIIRKDKPVIVAGFGPPALKNKSGIDGLQFLEFLLQLGYKLSVLDGTDAVLANGNPAPVLKAFENSGTDHIDILAEQECGE